MHFNEHSDLVSQHAFLSASNYHWINYDIDRLGEVYRNSQMAKRGTALHDFAHRAIRLGIKLPSSQKTLNRYVNDAIGYRMSTEQVLFYSRNCFGHTDAIAFAKDLLRIHDLKTGVIPGNMHQLEIYAAMFCLEYDQKPGVIGIELRIYQGDEVIVSVPDPKLIMDLMALIVVFDRHIESMRAEA